MSSQSCLKKKISPQLPMMLSCKEVRLSSKELKVTILKILKKLIQNFNLECVTKKSLYIEQGNSKKNGLELLKLNIDI